MKSVFAILLLLTASAVGQSNENNLPVTNTVSDTDKVRVVQGGASKNAPASAVRTITASKISDMTVVGKNWLTTASPGAATFPMVNANNTVSYLTSNAFLAAVGAGAATLTIQEVDGSPSIVGYTVLRVPNGSLIDVGGGVAQLTFTAGGGGGGTWGSITGILSDQVDLQAALDGKQPVDTDLTAIAALTTSGFGRNLLTAVDQASAQSLLGLQVGVNVQPYNIHLADLSDGSLSGSKVGAGIDAANITTGTLALTRGGLAADVSGYGNGLIGMIAGITTDVDTIAEFSTALGTTGTPGPTTVLRGDNSWGASPGAISVREEDNAPNVSTVTEIRVTNGSLTDNGAGSVSLNLSGGAGGGDVISDISSATSQQIALYNGTTGKHIINYTGTGLLSATAGVIGTISTSATLDAAITDNTGSGSLVFSNGPTFTSPQLGAASASSLTSPIFQSSAGDPADSGLIRLANNESIAWEANPAGTDATLSYSTSNVLTASVPFSASSLFEGANAVPNATDNLSFFSSTTSAQLASILSDEVGTGRVLFDTSPTLTTPTINGLLTLNNGISYSDAPMAALAIDTAELANTKTVNADSPLTFSAAPGTGSFFGLFLTNSDVVAHTITIPPSNSDARGGATTTSFVLAPTSTIYLKWQYRGAGAYTVWGDPFSINDLTPQPTPNVGTDYVMIWDATAGLHKKVLLNALPTGSGDNVSVNTVAVVDPDFRSTGDITFTAVGSPAVVTATVNPDSVALTTDTTGNYVATLTAGLGLTGSVASEGATPTIALDTTAALSGDHTLGANEVRFGQSGIIFEGSTADTIEGYLAASDPTGSDKTWTLPNRSGTIVLSGDTFTGNVSGTLNSSGTTTLTITGNSVNGADIAMGGDVQGDILYYDGTDYARLGASTAGFVLQTGGAGANPSWVNSATTTQTLQNKDLTNLSNTLPAEMVVACSDETTPLTSGTAKVTFRMPYAMTVTGVRASLTTAQGSGSLVTVQINKNALAILSTALTINNGSRTSVGATTPAVIATSALADDDEITIDVTAVGTGGAGLKVALLGSR